MYICMYVCIYIDIYICIAGLTEKINLHAEDKTKDIISNFQKINDPKYQVSRADKKKQVLS
jgi:hypothetical protein